MSYMHIQNLYKCQDVLLFKELYALEKINGTSARITWNKGNLHLSPGACNAHTFESLFNTSQLRENFVILGHDKVVVYGEQYGGKMQRMTNIYGKDPRFIAFEVKVGNTWLRVPDAYDVAHNKLGLDFVHYVKIPATMDAIDEQMNAESVQAVRNGVGPGKLREGVVLRPLIEVMNNRDERIIAKHKGEAFKETATSRKVGDPLKILAGQAAALEWVTDTRLEHVLDKIPGAKESGKSVTGDVVRAMLEDVTREGGEEVLMTKETRTAISKETANRFHAWLLLKD